MAKRSRQHPVLGRLRWDEEALSWEARLDLLPGCPIRFAVVAEAEWASVKLSPARARRSMLDVRPFFAPLQDTSPKPRSSA